MVSLLAVSASAQAENDNFDSLLSAELGSTGWHELSKMASASSGQALSFAELEGVSALQHADMKALPPFVREHLEECARALVRRCVMPRVRRRRAQRVRHLLSHRDEAQYLDTLHRLAASDPLLGRAPPELIDTLFDESLVHTFTEGEVVFGCGEQSFFGVVLRGELVLKARPREWAREAPCFAYETRLMTAKRPCPYDAVCASREAVVLIVKAEYLASADILQAVAKRTAAVRVVAKHDMAVLPPYERKLRLARLFEFFTREETDVWVEHFKEYPVVTLSEGEEVVHCGAPAGQYLLLLLSGRWVETGEGADAARRAGDPRPSFDANNANVLSAPFDLDFFFHRRHAATYCVASASSDVLVVPAALFAQLLTPDTREKVTESAVRQLAALEAQGRGVDAASHQLWMAGFALARLLTPTAATSIYLALTLCVVPPQTTIISSAHICDRVVMVSSGRCAYRFKDGTRVVVDGGLVVGDTCLAHHRWMHQLVAVDWCVVWEAPVHVLHRLLEEHHALGRALRYVDRKLATPARAAPPSPSTPAPVNSMGSVADEATEAGSAGRESPRQARAASEAAWAAPLPLMHPTPDVPNFREKYLARRAPYFHDLARRKEKAKLRRPRGAGLLAPPPARGTSPPRSEAEEAVTRRTPPKAAIARMSPETRCLGVAPPMSPVITAPRKSFVTQAEVQQQAREASTKADLAFIEAAKALGSGGSSMGDLGAVVAGDHSPLARAAKLLKEKAERAAAARLPASPATPTPQPRKKQLSAFVRRIGKVSSLAGGLGAKLAAQPKPPSSPAAPASPAVATTPPSPVPAATSRRQPVDLRPGLLGAPPSALKDKGGTHLPESDSGDGSPRNSPVHRVAFDIPSCIDAVSAVSETESEGSSGEWPSSPHGKKHEKTGGAFLSAAPAGARPVGAKTSRPTFSKSRPWVERTSVGRGVGAPPLASIQSFARSPAAGMDKGRRRRLKDWRARGAQFVKPVYASESFWKKVSKKKEAAAAQPVRIAVSAGDGEGDGKTLISEGDQLGSAGDIGAPVSPLLYLTPPSCGNLHDLRRVYSDVLESDEGDDALVPAMESLDDADASPRVTVADVLADPRGAVEAFMTQAPDDVVFSSSFFETLAESEKHESPPSSARPKPSLASSRSSRRFIKYGSVQGSSAALGRRRGASPSHHHRHPHPPRGMPGYAHQTSSTHMRRGTSGSPNKHWLKGHHYRCYVNLGFPKIPTQRGIVKWNAGAGGAPLSGGFVRGTWRWCMAGGTVRRGRGQGDEDEDEDEDDEAAHLGECIYAPLPMTMPQAPEALSAASEASFTADADADTRSDVDADADVALTPIPPCRPLPVPHSGAVLAATDVEFTL